MLKNEDFRKKNLRGAKVEDLYFFVEQLKRNAKSEKELEKIQQFIEYKFDYEPVEKNVAN